MIEIDEAVVVARPRDALFQHLTRIEAFPTWLPFVRSAALIDGTDVRAGSRFRLDIDGPGSGSAAIGEVTELVPPERIAIRTIEAPADLEAACALEGVDGGTRLRLTGRLSLRGPLRLAEGMVRGRIQRETPAALEDLRQALESAVPAGGSGSL